MRRGTVIAVAALTLLAGCSSTAAQTGTTSQPTTPTVSSTSMSKSDASAQYLKIVAPANASLKTMAAELQKLPDSATGADAAKIMDPAADAVDTACEALLRVEWPDNVTTDIKSLVVAFKTVTGDLRSIDGQNAFSIASWKTQFASDSGKASAASSIVRADLGLPPLS